MQDKDTSWYNNVFGTGMNIFGGGPGANTQNLIDSGLLKKEAVEKAQNQSLTKGLLTTALSFMANPQNQNYGQGITPYLGKALQAGVSAAQDPFDNLTTIAGQNQKLEEYNDKKAAKLKATESADAYEKWKKRYLSTKFICRENIYGSW